MSSDKVTRGFGLLEKFLSIQRMKKAQKIIKKFKKSNYILDIGCGSYPLFLINSDFEVKCGIDQEIEEMEIKSIHLHLKQHDICANLDLPFENNYFDVITMLAFIEHLNSTQLLKVLKDSYSMLKDNGILIITTPASWSDIPLKIMAKLRLVSSEEIEEHKKAFTLIELNKLLLKANFKQENIQKGYFEFFLNLWAYAKK